MRSGRDTRCRGLRDPSSSTIIFEKVDDQGRKYGVRVERTLERSEDDLTLDFKLSVFGDFPDEAVFIPNGYHPFELEIEQVVICEFFRLVSFRGAHAPSANVEMTFRSSRNENAQFLKDRLGVHLEETFVFKRWPAVFEEKDDYRWEAPAGYGSTVVGLERDIPLADLSPSIGSAT